MGELLGGSTGPRGAHHDGLLESAAKSAARRQGLVVKAGAKKRRPPEPLRIGFTFNVKRVDSKHGNDAEAEYDAPETIDAIRQTVPRSKPKILIALLLLCGAASLMNPNTWRALSYASPRLPTESSMPASASRSV